jgi:hypothetical protein
MGRAMFAVSCMRCSAHACMHMLVAAPSACINKGWL